MSLTENQDNSEEFIVCREKVGVIDSVKAKIERLFGTRVYFAEVSRDGDKEKRWVKVTGGKWDRQNAKTYILGISDPEETRTVKCSADFLDNEILEDIEKNTQAVLDKPSPNSVKISGSELAVTLALSALEEITGCVQDVDRSPSETENKERYATKRLDEKLDETFGEGGNSYHSYPSSIKRVLLECSTHLDSDGCDVPEEMLHGIGVENKRKTSSEVLVRRNEEQDPRKISTAPICRRDAGATTDRGDKGFDESDVERSSEVLTVTEQFPSAAQISPVRHKSGRGACEESLREFAKNVGYTDDEVEEGFLYVQPPMKPTEFLDVLKRIKEGKHKLGLSDEETNGQPAVRDESVVVVSDEEEEIMIVEDHFKQASNTKKPLSPKNNQGGLSKKQKKKNEQKQSDLARQFEQQQNNTRRKERSPKSDNSFETQDKGGKNVKKQQMSPLGGNVSGTKRKSDPDSDHEQTCVMKVWEPNQSMTNQDSRNQPRSQRMVEPSNASASSFAQQPQRLYPQVVPQVPVPMSRDPPPAPSEQRGPYPNLATHFDGSPAHRTAPLDTSNLRYVIIDGSNVAMSHGNNKFFSCKGIQIAVDFFLDRGHKVTVFIPEWRKYRNYADNRIRDQEILGQLEDAGHLVFTPSRKINGRLVASYDDRFILSLAEKEDSVILSNDQYRDLMREKASWKKIVEERLLMYRFVGDHFMPAEDPLGRDGPMLDQFLQRQPTQTQPPPLRSQFQPQQRFDTRGINQLPRFPVGHWQADGQTRGGQGHNPYRGQGHFQNGGQNQIPMRCPGPNRGQGAIPLGGGGQGAWQVKGRQPLQFQQPEKPRRHEDVTERLLSELKNVFSEPWQEEKLKKVLDNHRSETDLNRLTNYCMEVIFQ